MEMASQEWHRWTLCDLIVAFLELALAYCLLCGSAFVFLAAKFLLVFGLYVPCPCTGILGYQNRDLCLHKLLFDWPLRKIYTIQKLAKTSFPFDLVWRGNKGRNSRSMLHTDGKCENGVLKLDDQTGSSSVSGLRLKNVADEENEFDVKGKKIITQKQKAISRHRRKAALGYGKSSSVLLAGNMQSALAGVSTSRNNASQMKSETKSHGEIANFLQDDGNATRTGINLDDTSCHGVEVNVSYGDIDETNKNSSFVKKLVHNAEDFGSEANMIKMLEQALQEEKAARAAVYLELEKERAAAATAADEAMAMILRLQADKASLEMEGKQYERMMEEKFAYDEEEMNILKEILVRRERENHFLEKELEAYKQMDISGNEMSEADLNEGHLDETEVALEGKGICQVLSAQTTNTCSSIEKSFSYGENVREKTGESGVKTSCHEDISSAEREPIVYDVHVIEDKTELHKEGSGRESECFIGDKPRIDTEIEWLREKLQSVQKEKEELTSSVEYKERVSAQLKLMEEIMNQLREIEQQREPVNHDASPSSTKL